jgi:hypothetical protein
VKKINKLFYSILFIWTCLHHKGPELHLDLSTLQRAVQLLEVSTLQGPELSLDFSTLQWLVLVLDSIREIGSSIPRNIYFEILLSMR